VKAAHAWSCGEARRTQDGLRVRRESASPKLDADADYLMWADTPRWIEMGKGEYRPQAGDVLPAPHFDALWVRHGQYGTVRKLSCTGGQGAGRCGYLPRQITSMRFMIRIMTSRL